MSALPVSELPSTRREPVRRLNSPAEQSISPDWLVKTTRYFDAIRHRSDRAIIRQEWIERAIKLPLKEAIQTDGRIRRWVCIPEMDNRYLRVILLADGETVHNAFVDRRFMP